MMPFILLVFGILFLVVSIRGTQSTFFSLIKSEFVGNNSFVVWASALVILGMIAYIRPIRAPAQALLGLVLLVIVIANKGFFQKFNQAIRNPASVAAPASGSGSGSGTGAVSTDFTGSGIGANTGGILGWVNSLTGSGAPGTPTANAIVSGGITGLQGSSPTYNPSLWSPGQ